MGKKKIDNKIFREKFSIRLSTLTEKYIKDKESIRTEQNRIINQRNKENRKKWKASLRSMADFRPEELLPKYTIERFCNDLETKYLVDFPYKNYNLYTRGETFPDDVRVISALAKTFGVSFEYMYGLSDEENEVTASIEKQIPLSRDAINTLRNLQGKSEIIAMLNAILSDEDDCIASLYNLYEEQYKIYRSKSTGTAYTRGDLMNRFIEYEHFLYFLESHILPEDITAFSQRLDSELKISTYRIEHPEDGTPNH